LGGCRLLEEDRRSLSFWTVTLPKPALKALAEVSDGVAAFQESLRQEIERLLRRRGLNPEVVGVAEIQPERLRRTGEFAPHWHLVFRGRKTAGHGWALNRAELDHLIALCLHRVCGCWFDCSKAGNVQQVRKSVAAYLGKYMKKGLCPQAQHLLDSAPVNLIPKQWWLMTEPLRKALITRTFCLNTTFLQFVDAVESFLESEGLLFVSWHLKEDTHLWIKRTAFRDLDALQQILNLFQAEADIFRHLKGEVSGFGRFCLERAAVYQ
jgi:hypothetical protein